MNQAKLAAVLRQAARSGLYHLPVDSKATITAACPDFCHLHADLRHTNQKADVLAALGLALDFPDYYGGNFDALQDCLTDPDWHPATGYVLFIDGLDNLKNTDAASYATLLEVFQAAAEEQSQRGTPFWILLDHASADLPALTACL